MPSLVTCPDKRTVPLCASAEPPHRSSSGVLAVYVPCPHSESLEMVRVSVTSRLPSVPVHVAGVAGSPPEQAERQKANSNALGPGWRRRHLSFGRVSLGLVAMT